MKWKQISALSRKLKLEGAIFHFHDFGRKGMSRESAIGGLLQNLSNDQGTLGISACIIGDEKLPSYIGDCFISHDIRIPINQSVLTMERQWWVLNFVKPWRFFLVFFNPAGKNIHQSSSTNPIPVCPRVCVKRIAGSAEAGGGFGFGP